MKRLALLLALCLFVQCIGLTAAFGDEVPVVPAVEEGIATGNEEAAATGNEEAAATGNEEAAATGNEEATATGNEEAAATGNEEAAVTGNEEAAATGNEEAAADGEEAVAAKEDAAPAFVAYLATLKGNTVLYKDWQLSIKKEQIAADSVVIVLAENEQVAKVQYAIAGEAALKLEEAFTAPGALQALTEGEASSWQSKAHDPSVKGVNGFVLEVVELVVEEKVEEMPVQQEEVKAEEKPEAPADVQGADDNASIGEAATDVVTPEAIKSADGEAADVLGTGEYEFLADVLGTEGGSTDFAVNAAGSLIEYNGNATVVQIPTTVKFNGVDTTVTGIERSAFQGNTTVVDIIIPTTVSWVDDEAFKDCTALQHINLPDQVTVINSAAFYNCLSLRNVSWTDSVTIIRDRAFYNCPSLTTLGTSSNVTQIGDYAFYGCSGLSAVTWSDALTQIGKYCFANCTSLGGLSFPATLTTVDDYAFAGCTGIQKVEFQGNTTMQRINTGAFQNCTALKAIYIPDSVSFIGNNAFENCASATILSLPTSLGIIQDSTFRNCSSLTSLSIPNGVTEIHQYAFYGCSNVDFVYSIPTSVTFIGNYAFAGLKSDCSIVVENAGVVISKEGLGTNTNLFGWLNSTAQAYAAGYPNVNFYDIRIVQYVERCYTIILNRNGEGAGVMYWSKQLAHKNRKGVDIVHDFMFSTEFTNRVVAMGFSYSDIIEILYQAMQGRASDPSGMAYWLTFLNAGCSYDYVIRGFGLSPEFNGICNSYGIEAGILPLTQNRDQNVSVTAFVNRCYNLIQNRAGEPDGLNYWTGELLSKRLSGGQVVASFIASAEFRNRGLSIADQIEIIYNTMLDRASDPTGKAYWQVLLTQNMTAEAVVKGFCDSVEFNFLCERYGINATPVYPSQYRDWNRGLTVYINRVFNFALKRDADVDSLNTMTHSILSKKATVNDVTRVIFTSLECQMQQYTNSQFVDAVYRAMLNRAPNAIELSSGTAALDGGQTRGAFVNVIGGTAEFLNFLKSIGL